MVMDYRELRRSRRLRAASATSSYAPSTIPSSLDDTTSRSLSSAHQRRSDVATMILDQVNQHTVAQSAPVDSTNVPHVEPKNGRNKKKIEMTWEELDGVISGRLSTTSLRPRRSSFTCTSTPNKSDIPNRPASTPSSSKKTQALPSCAAALTSETDLIHRKATKGENDEIFGNLDDRKTCVSPDDLRSISKLRLSASEVLKKSGADEEAAALKKKKERFRKMRARVSLGSDGRRESESSFIKAKKEETRSMVDALLQEPYASSSMGGETGNVSNDLKFTSATPCSSISNMEDPTEKDQNQTWTTRKSREIALKLANRGSRRNRWANRREDSSKENTFAPPDSNIGQSVNVGPLNDNVGRKTAQQKDAKNSDEFKIRSVVSPEKSTQTMASATVKKKANPVSSNVKAAVSRIGSCSDRSEITEIKKLSGEASPQKNSVGNASSTFRSPSRSIKTHRVLRSSFATQSDHGPLKQLPLSLEREKNRKYDEALRCQVKKEADPGTRRNLDKRSARLRYSDEFRADIAKQRKDSPYLNNGNHNHYLESNLDERAKNGVTVFIRKRPIFDYEIERGDYDVVSVDSTSRHDSDTVVIHNCVMHADMKQMLIKPISFPCSAAFDENCSDDTLYSNVAEPLVRLAARGGVATILMYGQTGSGKTYTMTGIERRMATNLFQAITAYVDDESSNDSSSTLMPSLTIQFVELLGKTSKDLLGRGAEIKLADNVDGSVTLVNATCKTVKNPTELARLIATGKSRRATEATDVNGVSSRSHAVCQIQINFVESKNKKRGLLTLIDCAGSERRNDSMYHNKERQKESAEINASLYALKECIRKRALNASNDDGHNLGSEYVPYRSSSLTRILRESFEREGARLCVIATVAPNATDTEHTIETLKTVAKIVGMDSLIAEESVHHVSPSMKKNPVPMAPKYWNHQQLVEWVKKKRLRWAKIPDSMNGKIIMRMPLVQMRLQLFDEKHKDDADKLFNLLRDESERVARLQRIERIALAKERKSID